MFIRVICGVLAALLFPIISYTIIGEPGIHTIRAEMSGTVFLCVLIGTSTSIGHWYASKHAHGDIMQALVTALLACFVTALVTLVLASAFGWPLGNAAAFALVVALYTALSAFVAAGLIVFIFKTLARFDWR